jgi:hypothetical protein
MVIGAHQCRAYGIGKTEEDKEEREGKEITRCDE